MLWLKAIHIIFVVTWFAGLFYLPRLFVYHTEVQPNDPAYQRFCIMERKLFWGIMTPSAIITVLLGLGLLHYWMAALQNAGWLHTKIALVIGLLGFHGFCYKYLKDFKMGRNRKSHKFYRVFNEIPVFFLIAIVLLVVLKPF